MWVGQTQIPHCVIEGVEHLGFGYPRGTGTNPPWILRDHRICVGEGERDREGEGRPSPGKIRLEPKRGLQLFQLRTCELIHGSSLEPDLKGKKNGRNPKTIFILLKNEDCMNLVTDHLWGVPCK